LLYGRDVTVMGSILDIRNPWRDQLIPASFRGARFHCEQQSIDTGRRLVIHEFPKRDRPYTEDMGQRTLSWTVRGYCICYPFDAPGNPLYQKDYREPRDALYRVLVDGQPGILQVQTLPPLSVWCQRFRMSEEERLGGYVVFDMTFVDAGIETFPEDNTRT